MIWHLDTNIAIAQLNGNREVDLRITEHVPRVAISSLVLAELLFGVRNSSRYEMNLTKLREFLGMIQVAAFGEAAAHAYAEARFSTKAKGVTVPNDDLLIAAHALAENATLVTHNTAHFGDIPGLQLEDWLA